MKWSLSILLTAVLLGGYAGGQMVSSHSPTAATSDNPPLPTKDKDEVSTSLLQPTGKAVVKVNGTVLTDRDLMHELYIIFPYAQMHQGIPKSMEPEMRRGAMDMIIFDELVYQDALRRKLTVPDSKYEAARKHFMEQFPSAEAFHAFLAQECNGSEKEFHRRLMRSLLIEALVKVEIKDKAKLTDLQVRRVYQENLSKFDHPEGISFQSISIVPPQGANPTVMAEARARAEKLEKAAKETKSYEEFGILAEKESEDDYRVNMGDHKIVAVSKLPPEIVKASNRMKPGEVSDLIPIGANFTIFRLNARVPAGRTPFEQVKSQLRSDLEKAKTEQLRKALYRKLRSTAKIQEL